jgi:hypothetical protein
MRNHGLPRLDSLRHTPIHDGGDLTDDSDYDTDSAESPTRPKITMINLTRIDSAESAGYASPLRESMLDSDDEDEDGDITLIGGVLEGSIEAVADLKPAAPGGKENDDFLDLGKRAVSFNQSVRVMIFEE